MPARSSISKRSVRAHSCSKRTPNAINHLASQPSIFKLSFATVGRSAFTSPPVCGRIGEAELVENPPYDRVDNFGYGTRTTVERWNSGKHNRSGFEQRDNIASVNQTPRRLAGHDN